MTRCPTHDVAQPCNGCLADHHAGEHTTQPQPDLCPRCETTPAETDNQALAAGDDSLTDPNEETRP
jgi:hypothetical protein